MRDAAFACSLTDADLVKACAPEQPGEVKVGQEWMRCSDGNVLPVKRVRDEYIDLGVTGLTVVLPVRALRDEWVCIDPPREVTDIEYARRLHRG